MPKSEFEAVAGGEDVARLQGAMDDVGGVQFLQRPRQLDGDFARQRGQQPRASPMMADEPFQVAAVGEFDHDGAVVVVRDQVEHAQDVIARLPAQFLVDLHLPVQRVPVLPGANANALEENGVAALQAARLERPRHAAGLVSS